MSVLRARRRTYSLQVFTCHEFCNICATYLTSSAISPLFHKVAAEEGVACAAHLGFLAKEPWEVFVAYLTREHILACRSTFGLVGFRRYGFWRRGWRTSILHALNRQDPVAGSMGHSTILKVISRHTPGQVCSWQHGSVGWRAAGVGEHEHPTAPTDPHACHVLTPSMHAMLP